LHEITFSFLDALFDRIRIYGENHFTGQVSTSTAQKILTRRTLFSLKEMDLESAQNNVVEKLPLLKQCDYEMWKVRIEQYFQVQDYALWDVIENGNFFKPVPRTIANADGTSTLTIPGPVTTKEKA
nr:hypothetical protein [Tanacetum cinerariifolium]